MFARLEWMKLAPQQVLDLGCGLGTDMESLAERYPGARVCGLDLAQAFLEFGKKERGPLVPAHPEEAAKQPFRKTQGERLYFVVGDAHTLPLRSHSVDLIFANLLLPWAAQPVVLLRECRRILRPEGLLFFSGLGPDTFKEGMGKAGFLPGLIDMHPVGDALLEEGFTDPVLEVENLTFTYRSEEQCHNELEKSGMWRKEGEDAGWPSCGDVYPVTFEVVYGHAWCPAVKGFKADEQGVARIPISQLKKSSQP